MGVPGSEFIKSTKTSGAAQTSVTLQNADDSKLTPPGGGLQAAVVAIHAISTAAFGAGALYQVQDGATVVLTFELAAAAKAFYQEFSNPLRITSGTNDLRIVASFASADCRVTVWYKYV